MKGQTLIWDNIDPKDPAYEAFLRFHLQNPRVYDELRRLAFQLRRRGHAHYGVGGLYEVLRWQFALSSTEEKFKLNNNYRAYYARLLMKNEPELDGFFECRESKADKEN